MSNKLAYTLMSDKPFETVVANIEQQTTEHGFKVLHIHDVQETLAGKGFERDPLKIIQVCNAKFAHEALGKDMGVALFMPCKITVHTEGDDTVMTLARPTMISEMLPEAGLEQLAAEVETTLKSVMEASK